MPKLGVQEEVLSFGVSDTELSTNTGVTDMTKREEQGEKPNFGPRPKFHSKVLFLGHTLSKDGISPNPKKVQKVKDWPVPSNAKEVHSFLGLASYYCWFILQFVKWASPLHELICPIMMKKTRARIKLPPLQQNLPPFQWTTDQQESFNKLKLALTSAPVLAYPNYEKPFLLETDASLKGLGAVLSQEDDDGNMRIISYVSHTLKLYEKSMRNYSSTKVASS